MRILLAERGDVEEWEDMVKYGTEATGQMQEAGAGGKKGEAKRQEARSQKQEARGKKQEARSKSRTPLSKAYQPDNCTQR
jgi:hypothetical protein